MQKLHLLKQVQKFVGQVCPEALMMEVRDDLTLARNVALAQEHMLLHIAKRYQISHFGGKIAKQLFRVMAWSRRRTCALDKRDVIGNAVRVTCIATGEKSPRPAGCY
ncbi:hypothetical protein [Mesorhizobium sp.]|uniref:hypothetical protein n=1 Tax=Mesorhizobium sp. TaxID=1871066 RepID=UPI0025E783FA|nr:hypothetical protein [Mesorhizobium sp.]